MRRAFISIGLLLLCCCAAFASTPSELASFLNSLKSSGSCSSPIQTGAREEVAGVVAASAYCEASCDPYSSVSCSGSSCSAVDRNCSAGQRGYVQCDGVYTYCPVCPCQEGAVEYRDGGCCVGGLLKTLVYECINGSWVRTETICSGPCW